MTSRRYQKKKGSGAKYIRPAIAPVSHRAIILLYAHPKSCQSGGQNLAALCAAAGKNLAAVGSSHSLTESVNLGTVTAAGLVGTLHIGYTS